MNDQEKPIRITPIGKPAAPAVDSRKLRVIARPASTPENRLQGQPEPVGGQSGESASTGHPGMEPIGMTPHGVGPEKGKSGNRTWVWILLVVLLVAAGGVGWWFMAGKDGGDDGAEDTAGSPPAPSPMYPTDPPQSQEGGRQRNAVAVNPVLQERSLVTYSLEFGGRVPPECCSFTVTNSGIKSTLPIDTLGGNPVYFLSDMDVLWKYRVSGSGNEYIFSTMVGKYSKADTPIYFSLLRDAVARKTRGTTLAKKTDVLCENAWLGSRRYPAPAVMAYTNHSTRFLYLNDTGNPSVLEWGETMKYWFWCHEGAEALAEYAGSLRKLKQTLIDYSNIAREEGLRQYSRAITIDDPPVFHIGQLDEGTREPVEVEYEFVVENGISMAKEISKCGSGTYSRRWTLEALEDELDFFSRFETAESTEKAFEPLYCYLTQMKILFEEAALEVDRVENRFEGGGQGNNPGKKDQQLTFAPVGPQTTTSRVNLSATADSGGKVVFSVDSGPGKIDGDTLTFTGTGEVVVRARQWGDETWHSATATQTIEVNRDPVPAVSPERKTQSDGSGTTNAAQSGARLPGERTTGTHRPATSTPPPELAGMKAALEALQGSQTPPNLAKVENEWKALSGKWKSALQKNVMWASCAIFLQHGNTTALAKRKAFLDAQALASAVSDKCRACNGTGHNKDRCRECSGTGRCSFCHGSGRTPGLNGRTGPCPKCNSSGRCLACSGGIKESSCRMCSGSGRTLSATKCQKVVDDNIAQAIRICRGEE